MKLQIFLLQRLDTLLQRLAVLRHLSGAVARRYVLRTVPVKRLQMKAKQALHPGAVIVRRDPSQQPGIIVLRQHLDGGIDFQPGAARVIHQKQAGPVAAAQVAGGDVLPVAAKIRHRQGGVIQQMEKTRRPAAMLDVGPAGLR